MSTSYRKSTGGRQFIKMTGKDIVEVLSGEEFCVISLWRNEFKQYEIEENIAFLTATEEEFSVAYKNALARITLQRLDI